jgi:hypothetical protein
MTTSVAPSSIKTASPSPTSKTWIDTFDDVDDEGLDDVELDDVELDDVDGEGFGNVEFDGVGSGCAVEQLCRGNAATTTTSNTVAQPACVWPFLWILTSYVPLAQLFFCLVYCSLSPITFT